MKRLHNTWLLGCLAVSACGGGNEPPQAPAVSSAAAPAPEPKAVESAPPAPPPAPKASMAELQQKFVADELAAFNAHDAEKYSTLFTEDAVTAGPGPAGMEETKGRAAIAKSFADLFAAFPDIQCANLRVLTKDNVVVEQWVGTGTHKGDFNGMKASGKTVGINGISISWLNDDGLVTMTHTYMDQATIASQVGASKAPARPVAKLPTDPTENVAATGSDTEKKNADTLTEFAGTFAKKDLDAFLKFHSDKAVYSDFGQPKDIVGHAGAKALFKQYTTAFPDLVLNPTSVWGIGDYVVLEFNFTGTQKGAMGPIKATNKPVTVHGANVTLVKDGKLEHGWGYASNLELLGELGLLTPPAAAAPAKKAATPAAPVAAAKKPATATPPAKK